MTIIVNHIEADHLFAVRATLGEGPLWDRDRGLLWFVDIARATIHRFAPDTGEHCSWPAPAKVGWVALADGGDLIAGLAKGLYRFTPDEAGFALLHAVETDHPATRVNDGTRGPDGTYWFGTMSAMASPPHGRFYRYDGKAVSEVEIPPAQITNGPAVSLDGRTLYAVNTLKRAIHAYSIEADSSLGNERLFAKIDTADGYPDGVTCDAEGGVWVGLWNGWAARRYDASGVVTDVVRFPVANITKIALGGADGRTAYATTAREGAEGDTSGHQPLGGDVFSFRVAISGFAPGLQAAAPGAGTG